MKCIDKYISDIKSLMPFNSKKEKEYLKQFKKDILQYKENNDNITYDDLTEQFGYPKDIVYGYLDMQNNDYILDRISIKNTLKKTCMILIILFAFLSLWKGYLIYKDYNDSISYRATYTETTEAEEISNEKID
ncbi:MAG: DUF6120 family protein [Lachnospiraceae bacterium]|nr:DUF6120 family protein [Lachnospiraceae bacterium]